MIASLLQEDQVIRQIAKAPKAQKPQHDWRSVVGSREAAPAALKVNVGGAERDFDMGEIADTIGNTLADLFVARKKEDDIYNEANRQFVQNIAKSVAEELHQRVSQIAEGSGKAATLSARDLHQCIERALVKNNAHDVARTLAEKRKHHAEYDPFAESAAPQPLIVNTKVIRRSGQLVPWNHNKIEIAVRKAFLSLELDSSPAVQVAETVSRTIAEENKAFVHIEDVQNLVEEELMKQGFF